MMKRTRRIYSGWTWYVTSLQQANEKKTPKFNPVCLPNPVYPAYVLFVGFMSGSIAQINPVPPASPFVALLRRTS